MSLRAFLRRANERPVTRTGWLDSRHTFSFGRHHDPAWMGFGALRVINEDVVAAGGGFAPHRHANMEIVSIVLSGALAHRDSTGEAGVLRAGAVQWMSAGHGIEHSEFNGSDSEPVHFLQIWIQPDRVNAPPAYSQHHMDATRLTDDWQLLAGGDALPLRQDATIRRARLSAGSTLPVAVRTGRGAWLQLVSGSARLGETTLGAGDGLGLSGGDAELELLSGDGADVLLLDVPA